MTQYVRLNVRSHIRHSVEIVFVFFPLSQRFKLSSSSQSVCTSFVLCDGRGKWKNALFSNQIKLLLEQINGCIMIYGERKCIASCTWRTCSYSSPQTFNDTYEQTPLQVQCKKKCDDRSFYFISQCEKEVLEKGNEALRNSHNLC